MAETKKLAEAGPFTLLALGDGWSPWRFQIEHWAPDGAAWGKPGEKICTGWENFIGLTRAKEIFADRANLYPITVLDTEGYQ